ncbi:MAG: 5-formyltetrahydrofolate cyclo-ligase [Parachlamydiales bacterium]|nr:5-formyltetrahydrofolate cyclo-ligase [Parachlamydiales bacterium]
MKNAPDKNLLRDHYKRVLNTLPEDRRVQAAQLALQSLTALTTPFEYILSFSPILSEIDLSTLNAFLADQGKLVLPRVNGADLDLYLVDDILNQTKPSSWGVLEPDPKLCQSFDKNDAELALVPALAFDSHNHRLGRGKGIYDRFLKQFQCKNTYGIGYQEQFSQRCIPVDQWDVQLAGVFLF